jgi:hypothetical protein
MSAYGIVTDNPTYQYPFPYLDIDTQRRGAAK